MSEDYDYDPAPWAKAHDFGRARSAYDSHVGSSYGDAKKKKLTAAHLIEESVTSAADRPLIVIIDETGSMGDWPATMFSKLPYLDHEVRDYLGDDAEICFAAIGDANNPRMETYPLQVRAFASGADLKDRLTELVIEKDGGGTVHETYELAALYFARNLHVGPLAQPIVIFIGDEKFYDMISPDHARQFCRVELKKSMPAVEAFAELQGKASVYLIQKPYDYMDDNRLDETTKQVMHKWSDVLGEDHMTMLGDPNRVVDVIFGILAKEANRVDDFRTEIEGRQTKKQVDVVYKSLKTVHAVKDGSRKALSSGKSQLRNAGGGTASKPLGE